MMGYSTKSCRFATSRTTYVSVGNYHAFERTDSFSVSIWAKWSATGPTNYTMIGKMSDATLYRGWAMRANATGEVQVYLINDNSSTNQISVQTTARYNDGVWHHIVMTYDGSSTAAGVKIYVDNNLQTKTTNSDALSGTIVTTDELRLGARKTTGNETYFSGNLDEAAIYNKTLSAAETTAIWNLGTPNDLSLLGSASNLVGWWHMGEGDTYPTLIDHGSGSGGHNGTMTSMLATDIRTDAPPTTLITNYSTKSCQFRSGSQYVSMGNVLAYEYTQPFSVSLWFKSQDTVSGYLLSKRDGSAVGYGLLLKGDMGGLVEFGLASASGSATVRTTSTGWNNGVWHHIVAVSTGTGTVAGLSVYIDGVLQTTSTVFDTFSGTLVTTADFHIGTRNGASISTVGSVDEVSFYNKALAAVDAAALYDKGGTCDLTLLVGSDPNMVGWWRMGDGDTYPTLTDRSSSGFNGTMTNMAAYDILTDAPFPRLMTLDHTNWRFKANVIQPYSRKCLAFTLASSMYVSLGDNLGFERTATRSISFWAKWTVAANMAFIGKVGEGTALPGFMVYAGNTGLIGFQLANNVGTPNYLAVATQVAKNDGAWHHICVTYDGTSTVAGTKIYVDGVSQTLTTISNTLSATTITTAELEFGGRATSTAHYYLTGSMDEVSFYDSALSAAQVTALYNGKAPTNLLTMVSPAPAGLLGWWRMGDGDTAPTIADNSTGGHNGTMTNSPVITADWPTTGVYGTDHAIALRNIKNALTSSAGWTDSTGAAATLSTPWTVVASSNGTVANTSDNWNVNADIVWANAGTAHSWIILRQTGIISGQNVELLLECKDSTQYNLSVYVSYGAGFNVASPTIQNRPTALDEQVYENSATWFNSNTAFNAVWNFAVTDDGQCNRLWGLVAGSCKTCWLFDRPKNTAAGWTNPVIGFLAGATSSTYVYLNDTADTGARINGLNTGVFLTAEFYNGMAIGQGQTTVNSISNEWPLNRVGIACAAPGLYGRMGEVSDMWWTSTTPVAGDTFPATGTLKQFIVVPNMVLPWNQSTPVTT